MNEHELMDMIASGEHEGIDFKRELNLESKIDKGEFIKDVISIANSSLQNKGYLLIGINNDQTIRGIEKIEEERIQQIVHSYIRPHITVRCYTVSLSKIGPALIGVIEIEGTFRPHRVARPIGNLNQDDIFVRHGSVVTKATFEELEKLGRESAAKQEVDRFIKSAETHFSLGNFQEAINGYSDAIQASPSAALFYARGICYKKYALMVKKSDKFHNELLSRSYKDFLDAIKLTDSIEFEKSVRLERFRIFHEELYDYEGWDEDSEWLNQHTESMELGEILYLDLKAGEDRADMIGEVPFESLNDLNLAIELGYEKPEMYNLRARAHYFMHNYGLALDDVQKAFQGCNNSDLIVNLYCLRANIEAKIGKYNEAYNSFEEARRVSSELKFSDSWGYIQRDAYNSLWLFCLAKEYERDKFTQTLQAISQALLINLISKEVVRITGRGNKIFSIRNSIAGKESIEKEYPDLIPILIEMVGEEFWALSDDIARNGSLEWTIGNKK